jgi:Mg-chelatase subunit ChlD
VQARRALADARQERTAAETMLAQARARLTEAEALAARAAEQPDPQQVGAPAEPQTRGEQKVRISIADLDLVFVMDTTGSMRRELADMQANLIGVINILNRLSSSLRIGVVAYKDRGERYVTRDFPLRPMQGAEVGQILAFVRDLEASGGGDDPEPVDLALKVAIEMPWRADAQGRIVVIGDALARDRQAAFDLATQFRKTTRQAELPRVVSTIYAGDEPFSARFFEQIAAAGGGEYSVNQGQIMESVLLSILPEKGA